MSIESKFSRRDFLKFGTAATASGLLVPQWVLAQQAASQYTIPVIKDVNGIDVMNFIASESGINLGNKSLDDAQKYLSVQRGNVSSKPTWAVTNASGGIVLADQIKWTQSETEANRFRVKQPLNAIPNNIDYVIAGSDTFVLNTSAMPAEWQEKIKNRFGEPGKIELDRQQVLAFAQKDSRYTKKVEDADAALEKIQSVSAQRKSKERSKDILARVNGLVTPSLETSLYAGLAKEGVRMYGPIAALQAEQKGQQLAQAQAVERPYHREDPQGIRAFLPFEYYRLAASGSSNPGDSKIGNFGVLPTKLTNPRGSQYDPEIALPENVLLSTLRAKMGARDYELAMSKSASTRQYDDFATGRFHPTWAQRVDRAVFFSLAQDAVLNDVLNGSVASTSNTMADWTRRLQERSSHDFRTAYVAIVDPKKGS